MSKDILYKNKPATIVAEVNRRNPTFDRNRQIIEPRGRSICWKRDLLIRPVSCDTPTLNRLLEFAV